MSAPPPRPGRRTNPGCVAGLVAAALLGLYAVGRGAAPPDAPAVPAPVVAAATATAARPPTATAVIAPSPTAVPRRAVIGEPVAAGNWRVTAVSAERVDGPLQFNAFGSTAAPIGQWFLVTVELLNTGRQNFGVNEWDWELRDAAGRRITHSTEPIAYGLGEYRGLTPLGKAIPPGAAVRSLLIFDVAKGAQGLDLVFVQAPGAAINVG